jgi:hypothetical protein
MDRAHPREIVEELLEPCLRLVEPLLPDQAVDCVQLTRLRCGRGITASVAFVSLHRDMIAAAIASYNHEFSSMVRDGA